MAPCPTRSREWLKIYWLSVQGTIACSVSFIPHMGTPGGRQTDSVSGEGTELKLREAECLIQCHWRMESTPGIDCIWIYFVLEPAVCIGLCSTRGTTFSYMQSIWPFALSHQIHRWDLNPISRTSNPVLTLLFSSKSVCQGRFNRWEGSWGQFWGWRECCEGTIPSTRRTHYLSPSISQAIDTEPSEDSSWTMRLWVISKGEGFKLTQRPVEAREQGIRGSRASNMALVSLKREIISMVAKWFTLGIFKILFNEPYS